jgi:sporulation protein YlmC with PRC-barrel domain
MRRIAVPVLSAVALVSMAGCAQMNDWFGGSPDQASQPINERNLSTLARLEPRELMGKDVVAFDGQKVGTVDDVLMNRNDRPEMLVVGTGGFLGIGGKNVAVDVDRVRFSRERDALVATDWTRDQFAALPEYRYDGSMVSLNRSRSAQ